MNTRSHPWLLPLLWTGFGACALAMAASFLLPMDGWIVPMDGWTGAQGGSTEAGGSNPVQTSRLPEIAVAAVSFDPASDWRQRPDLPQLASGDAPLLPDLSFQAWHAAQISLPAGPGVIAPAPRGDLPQRVAEWDALAPAERSARREQWQAWQRLPSSEQAVVRDAAATFAALPPERQQELRHQFDQLAMDERHGWLLGPRLGQVWPGLQPLLMQVPAAQREPLLAVLHQCSASQLEELAVLAQRTPPQARAALRSELLETTESGRAAWLHERIRH